MELKALRILRELDATPHRLHEIARTPDNGRKRR